MKKVYLMLIILFTGVNMYAQDLYIAKDAKVSFFSKAPLEDIDAASEKATSLINIKTKQIVSKVAMKSFVFKKPLMQEHFNENYMESEKFPFGKFDGKILEDIDFSKDGTYPATVEGMLDIHGVIKPRTIKGTITIEGGKIKVSTEFQVKVADHNIEIPKLVIENIAEVIDAKFSAEHVLYKKE